MNLKSFDPIRSLNRWARVLLRILIFAFYFALNAPVALSQGEDPHARALLKTEATMSDLRSFVRKQTRRSLRPRWKGKSEKISTAILDSARKHSFDPVLLMAVIQSESRFSPRARGRHGEIGLMQLKPSTGRWIAMRHGLPWHGKKTLFDPVMNIRIGTAYLCYLRSKFNFEGKYYLAAYNMGAGNVYRAIQNQIVPRQYSSRVFQNYVRFYSALKPTLNSVTLSQNLLGEAV